MVEQVHPSVEQRRMLAHIPLNTVEEQDIITGLAFLQRLAHDPITVEGRPMATLYRALLRAYDRAQFLDSDAKRAVSGDYSVSSGTNVPGLPQEVLDELGEAMAAAVGKAERVLGDNAAPERVAEFVQTELVPFFDKHGLDVAGVSIVPTSDGSSDFVGKIDLSGTTTGRYPHPTSNLTEVEKAEKTQENITKTVDALKAMMSGVQKPPAVEDPNDEEDA